MDLDDDSGRALAPHQAGRRPERSGGLTAAWARGRRTGPGDLPYGDVSPIRTVVVRDDRIAVHVTGALDAYTVGALREALLDMIAADVVDIVVVLSGVTFVDSTGLGVLVGAHKRLRGRGGRLQLVVDQESVLKVIRITALHQVFSLYPTLDAALAG